MYCVVECAYKQWELQGMLPIKDMAQTTYVLPSVVAEYTNKKHKHNFLVPILLPTKFSLRVCSVVATNSG